MKKLKLTPARQERFLKALAETGNITAAVALAGTSRTRVYELRKVDENFRAGWDEAENTASDKLEAEAWRRAVDGVQEPLVSGGKIVRDDDGNPIAIRRYSDAMLTLLLKARRPEKFRERSSVEMSGPGGKPIEVADARQRISTELAKIAERFSSGTIGAGAES
jgi:hypothetical protein